MKYIVPILSLSTILILTGCGSTTTETLTNAQKDSTLETTDSVTKSLKTAQCDTNVQQTCHAKDDVSDQCDGRGGEIFYFGFDENGNSILDTDEIDDSKNVIICNGYRGVAGEDGEDGTQGEKGDSGEDGFTTLVDSQVIPKGDICLNSGLSFDIGIDTNRNTVLDQDEITSSQVLCMPTDVEEPSFEIVINEIRSTGAYDYIELYNNATETITFEADKWFIKDDNDDHSYTIPAGTSLAAGEHLLIIIGEDTLPAGAPSDALLGGDSGFGLGKGDKVRVFYDGVILDEQTWEAGTHVDTLGRLPDGGDWSSEVLVATPDAANKVPVPAGAEEIMINEVVSKGDFDYIELYNASSEPYIFADGEWEVKDDSDDADHTFPIPAGTVIPGKGFLVILPGESTLPAGAPADALLAPAGVDFGLGKGDQARLFYLDSEHEVQTWTAGNHVNSAGRMPDGGDWIGEDTLVPTPGAKNYTKPELDLEVNTLYFTPFNDQEAVLEAAGMRVFGPGAALDRDVEPEYVTVSEDSTTAWVSLQENNAIAKISLGATPAITKILPLGLKDYSATGNEIDASDKDDATTLKTYANVVGMFQPDSIASFSDGAINYVVTANEGDSRDYDGFSEEARVNDISLDATVFTDASIKDDTNLGRLKVTTNPFIDTSPASFDKIYSYGARSFSIFNGDTGALVYDSGSDIATKTIAAGVYPDNRSDDKGTEPEGVVLGTVDTKRLAFIGLERADAIMVYDITDLTSVTFSQMLTTVGDEAPEGLLFIAASESPSGLPILVVSNEDSGTVTLYQGGITGTFAHLKTIQLEGGEGAAEITSYDSATQKLFVINNGETLENPRIDVLDLSTPASTVFVTSIDVSPYGGGINSVAVHGGMLAAAIEAPISQDNGKVAVFDTTTYALKALETVGSLPDMVTFSPDGAYIITADEGEPSDDYTVDPLGSVSIITTGL